MSDSRLRRTRDSASGPATLINEGCKIVGLITGSGDFLVNGEVEGECDVRGTVTLARNGHWNGVIKAHNVIVAGHVDGDIEATGKVEITATAHIAGTVAGEAIAVAEGAVVEGAMKTTGKSKPTEFVEKRQKDND
jgi:cytoskeletal protein CcmA (bactofilin family)